MNNQSFPRGSEIMFRSHNFGNLMGEIKSGSLTEVQAKKVKELQEKETRTNKQQLELDALIAKRDAPPELNETAKTLVTDIFKEVVRGTYKYNLDNDYLKKGNIVEDSAIKRIAKVNGWGNCLKYCGNAFQDHIGFGNPDVFRPSIKLGFDAKSSWTDDTFPLFGKKLDPLYEWQDVRYMMLTGITEWHTCYSLENTPEHLVINHAWKLWRESKSEGQLTDSFLDDVRSLHNFDHLPDWARVKTFTVSLTDEHIAKVNKRAEMARNYFDELVETYKLMEK